MNLPAEAMELEAPIRVRRWSLRPGSGGEGTFRGGLGQVKEYEVLPTIAAPLSFSHRGERHAIAASGLAGGGPGARAVSVITRADGTTETIASKRVTTLGAGDRVVVETAGGGGWGEPAGREAARRKDDLANGKIAAAGHP